MLQNIRDNAQGTIAKIIIGLIVISFAFFGVESLIGGGGQTIATVNGEDIAPQQLENAILQERNRRLSAMGENLDPAMIDQDVLREVAMEQLIQQKLLLQLADKADIAVDSTTLDQTIISMKQFQEDGKFSKQLFQNILRSNGYSPAFFKSMLHNDLLIGQVSNGVTASEFVTKKELDSIAKVVGQKRSFDYLLIPDNLIADSVVVDDEAVKAYYDENSSRFETEDQVKLEYLEIQQQDFFKPASEDELQLAYELELEEFQATEERRASHILLEVGGDQSKADALEKAKSLLDDLRDGADFSELAAKESSDPGSSGNGGDLGYTAGDTFPAEFEEALFALTINEVSEPVVTDAGVHLIKLTDIKSTEQPSFEELKPVLEQRIKLRESEAEFVAAVEELKDLVFNSDGLKGPADELQLDRKYSDWITKTQAQGVLNDHRVIKAAFSDEVLKEGHNSSVIELAADHYIVVHVIEHQPPHIKELAEVEADIRSQLEQAEKINQTQKMATTLVERLSSGESRESIAKELDQQWVTRDSANRTASDVNREVLTAAFTLRAPSGPASPVIEAITLKSGEVAIVILQNVIDGDIQDFSERDIAALRAEVQQVLRSSSTNGFLTTLRDSADVEIF